VLRPKTALKFGVYVPKEFMFAVGTVNAELNTLDDERMRNVGVLIEEMISV
jgi:hypothetical protein